MKRIAFTLSAIVFLASPAFSQKKINVPTDQPSIQAGIDSASDGDTVLVAEGTYFENINLNGRAIVLASHYILDGDTSHISKTIIDGSQPSHPDTASVITLDSGEDTTTVITGFYITGGKGTSVESRFKPSSPYYGPRRVGGGILIQDAGCTISNNQICGNVLSNISNEQALGAGIQVYIKKYPMDEAIQVVIQNNLISENEIFGKFIFGAGIAVDIDTCSSGEEISLLIENNTISYNRLTGLGNHSSGISMGFVLPVRRGVYHFRGNHVHHNANEYDSQYSGSYYETGPVYVSYFSGLPDLTTNTQPWIYNNIIENNSGIDDCAGIETYSFANLGAGQMEIGPVIINNTIINNNVGSTSDGIGLRAQRTKPLVFNNIFWNSLKYESQKEFRSVGGEILAYHNIVKNGWHGSNNRSFDPNLDPLTFEPMPGSPCIGYGIKTIEIEDKMFEPYSWDYYSNNRPDLVDDLVDIGAVETPYEGFVYIPDTAFLHALIDVAVDTNGDSLISFKEAETVSSLKVGGSHVNPGEISDMEGIEAFVNLRELYCYHNSLTSLDVSNNVALEDLRCFFNQLTSLDVSGCTALTNLDCTYNILSSLDVSGCIALTNLDCGGHNLTGLDVSGCTDLTRLLCRDNQLANLDVSGNTSLEYLDCSSNKLTSLGVSGNQSLEDLDCSSNKLISLDVTSNTSLKDLDCSNNQLNNLDVSVCTALTNLECGDNQLTTLDVSGCTALTNLWCGDNQLSSLNVSSCTALQDLHCYGSHLTSLDVSGCTALTTLGCEGNQLTSLDVSGCKALEYLLCYRNQLISLDVSGCTALKRLWCSSNKLTSLDISNNTLVLSSGGMFTPGLNISNMPTLHKVCVWEMPFPPEGSNVDTTGSPNVFFTIECGEETDIEERNQSELSMYPNPTNSLLTIEIEYPNHYSINITTLNGQQILTEEMKGSSRQIDLSSFSKGVYFITIRSEDFVTTRKIIKL